MKVTDDDKDVDKVIKDISKLSTKQRIKVFIIIYYRKVPLIPM